jgi:hypothetical protein
LTKQLREVETIPSAGCFKKLLDSIDNSILQLPDFASYVTAKNSIDLYRALKEKFIIASNTGITSAENALNAVMQENEKFQDFKRRWDIAMINYIMVDFRTPRAGQPGHDDYPDILEVKANLLGEAEFARQYPGRAVHKTNAWLYERIIRSFANVREKVTSSNNYYVCIKCYGRC